MRNEEEAFRIGLETFNIIAIKILYKRGYFLCKAKYRGRRLNLISMDEMQNYHLRKNQEISLTEFFRSLKNN